MIILSINFQLLNLCTHGMRNIGKDSNFLFLGILTHKNLKYQNHSVLEMPSNTLLHLTAE